MTVRDIWQSLLAFYEPTLELLQLWAWGFPLFVALIASIFLIARQENSSVTLKALVEAVFPKQMYQHASGRVDRWNGILVLAIGFPLYALLAINAIAIADNLAVFLGLHCGAQAPHFQADWIIVAVQFSVYFLSLDFAGYWVHYWCHTVPWLWNLHKPHHTAETLTPWTNFRQHPIEFFILNKLPSLFAGLMTGLAIYLMGTPVHAGTVAAIGMQVYISFFIIDLLAHVHVPISYGWLNRIVLAPVMHNLHHSLEDQHRDKNNAVILTLWDWMFGTLYLPRKEESWRWGLNVDEYGAKNPHKTLRGFYLEPFVSSWKHFTRALPTSRKLSSGHDVS